MTNVPSNLLAVRSLLLAHLDDAPGPNDLEPAEVGIVGDSAHRGGYHCGSDRVDADDYSVDESPRDASGLTLDASALDVGEFEVTVGGRTYDLPHFSRWCAGQCAAKAPDTRDIREIIYSPDGVRVVRYDALGIRSSGDSSHLWHTHFSFFRDAIKARRDQTPLFRRYLTTIGLLEAPDMTPAELFAAQLYNPVTKANAKYGEFIQSINTEAYKARLTAEATLAAVKGLDTAAVLARINEVATADAQRDAELAELVRQGLSGELAADEVLRRMGEVLTAGTTPPAS